jgi:hypothetical protein
VVLSACSNASRTPAQYAEDTQKAFAEHQAELQTCYDAVVKTKPDAKGVVTMKFFWSDSSEGDARFPTKELAVRVNVKDKGEVYVDPAETTAPEELQKCVTDTVAKARLRPAGKGVGYGKWTFTFTPSASPSEPAEVHTSTS